MENRRGNEIFLGVVGVATLVVAIIGATFAYFSASVRGDNTVNVESAKLELGFTEDTTKLTTLLIPAGEDIAKFAGSNMDWISQKEGIVTGYEKDSEGNFKKDQSGQYIPITTKGKGLCADDNGNLVCGVYDFAVMNPNTTTMNITAEVITTVNTFEAGVMKFALYETTATKDTDGSLKVTAIGDQIGETKPFASIDPESTEEAKVPVEALNLRLAAATSAVSASNKDDLDSYKSVSQTDSEGGKTVRTFRMVIYLEESGEDQTELNSGKMLTAALRIKTLGGTGGGVTGVIAAANVTTPPAE